MGRMDLFGQLRGQGRVWDITRPLQEGMTIFPGDPAYHRQCTTCNQVTVADLQMGSHTGTHMDAPAHMIEGGATIDTLSPERFICPARVLSVKHNGAVSLEEIRRCQLMPGEAVLFKSPPDMEKIPVPIFLGNDTAQHLVDSSVSLVGIDSLSIESGDDPAFPVHHALLEAGVIILEGLRLSEVPPGLYQLVALPLLITDGDGSPARAVLIGP
jgi:arylformamidase